MSTIPPITLPTAQNPQQEGEWLQASLQRWLDTEFLPEPVNQQIAERAAQIFVRQRMEGENDVGSLVIAIVTEMQAFDFSKSFYGEFAIANAVSDLLLESLRNRIAAAGNNAYQLDLTTPGNKTFMRPSLGIHVARKTKVTVVSPESVQLAQQRFRQRGCELLLRGSC